MKTNDSRDLTQGRRPEQVKRNFGITHIVLLILIALFFALVLSSCATTKNTLPFYDSKKYGKNQTMKCKNHNRQDAWINRQWPGEGR